MVSVPAWYSFDDDQITACNATWPWRRGRRPLARFAKRPGQKRKHNKRVSHVHMAMRRPPITGCSRPEMSCKPTVSSRFTRTHVMQHQHAYGFAGSSRPGSDAHKTNCPPP